MMEWWRLAIAVILVLAIAWLLHAANVIGRNPYLRVKMHEDLISKFPPEMSLEDKQRLLDLRGVAKRNGKQTALYIAILMLGVALVFLVGAR
jgi:hypothetical protein